MAETSARDSTERNHKIKRSWWVPRFSLRTIMLVVTFFGITLGVWCERAERQRRALEQLLNFESRCEFTPAVPWFSALPEFVTEFRDGHYVQNVTSVRGQPAHLHDDDEPKFFEACRQLPALRELNLASRLNRRRLEELSRMTRLKKLTCGVRRLTAEDVPLLRKLKSIGEINFTLDTAEGDRGSVPFLVELTNITSLTLDCDDANLPLLARLPRLEALRVTNRDFTGKGLAELRNLPLRHFEVAGMNFDDQAGTALALFPRLEVVNLSDSCAGDETATALAKLPVLKRLWLDETLVGDRGAVALASAPQLKFVSISNTAVGPEALVALAQNKSLTDIRADEISLSLQELLSAVSPRLTIELRRNSEISTFTGDPSTITLSTLGESEGLSLYLSPDELATVGQTNDSPYSSHLPQLIKAFEPYGDDTLKAMARIPGIVELDLSSSAVSDKGLAYVAQMKSLERLDLSYTEVTRDGLEHLTALPALERLDLTGCQKIDHQAIDPISRMPALKEITIEGTGFAFPHIVELALSREWETLYADKARIQGGEADLRLKFHMGAPFAEDRNVVKGFPEYTSTTLDLSNDGLLNQAQIELLARAKTLRGLRAEMTDEQFGLLSDMDQLREIGFVGPHIGKRSIQLARRRKPFNHLYLKRVKFEPDDWEALHGATIQLLTLDDVEVSEACAKALAAMPLLKDVSLRGPAVTDEGLAAVVRNVPQLKILELEATNLSTEAIESAIRKSPDLWSIGINRARWNSHDLARFHSEQSLREKIEKARNPDDESDMEDERPRTHRPLLDLSKETSLDIAAQTLADWKRVEILRLSGLAIGDDWVKHFAQHRRLKELVMANTQVGDAGLAEMSGLRQLRFLDLRGTRVSDEGLVHLHGLRSAQAIDLRGTKVTPESVQQLRKALPYCRVIHSEDEAAQWGGVDEDSDNDQGGGGFF